MAKGFPTPTGFETRKEDDDFRRKRQTGLKPERMRFETQWRGGERDATRMKMRRRMEDDDSFRKRESDKVEQRWDKTTRCAEYPTRFETLVDGARRGQQRRGCERDGRHSRLRKMEHERNHERFGELGREVWDCGGKNRAEEARFDAQKGDDVRSQQKRFGELEREVREKVPEHSWEKNHGEKRRFGTQQGDDIRRKRKREDERAAERIKLQKMEDTVEIERNHESFRELEYLSGCRLSFTIVDGQVVTGVYQGSRFWNPLAELGLKLKDEYCCLDDEDVEDDAICHMEESYGDSNVIVEEKCKNSPDDSMSTDDKALRAAMLKSRYSQIILKAQQKRLFN